MKKCALITGASGGIGSEIALRLAADGYDIAACYFTDDKSAKVLEEKLSFTGAKYKFYKADVSDYNQIKEIFADAADYFGGVSVLVNNAGMSQTKLFTDITEEEFDRITAVNFKSVFNCCKFAVPYMVNQKQGKIINISSMWGVCGASCETVYSATKAAVIGFTKALARELDIPVIALCQVARDAEGQEPNLAQLRGSGSIEQDADVVLFLHRDRKIVEEENPVQEAKCIVAKQRNGATGDVEMMFFPAFTKFENKVAGGDE